VVVLNSITAANFAFVGSSIVGDVQWKFCGSLGNCNTGYTHTHTHTTIYDSLDFVRDNPGELVPEETFTHSHSSWS